MKTSKDFEGYFIMTEQSFFVRISESIRSKFVGLIYQYAHRPFVSLNEQAVQRVHQQGQELHVLSTVGKLGDSRGNPNPSVLYSECQ